MCELDLASEMAVMNMKKELYTVVCTYRIMCQDDAVQ